MKLDDIVHRLSILDMSTDEALELIRALRVNRRKQASRSAAQSRKKTVKPKLDLSNLEPEKIQEILTLLEDMAK